MAVGCGVLTAAQSSWLQSSRVSEVEAGSVLCDLDLGESRDSGCREHCVWMKKLTVRSAPVAVEPLVPLGVHLKGEVLGEKLDVLLSHQRYCHIQPLSENRNRLKDCCATNLCRVRPGIAASQSPITHHCGV